MNMLVCWVYPDKPFKPKEDKVKQQILSFEKLELVNNGALNLLETFLILKTVAD